MLEGEICSARARSSFPAKTVRWETAVSDLFDHTEKVCCLDCEVEAAVSEACGGATVDTAKQEGHGALVTKTSTHRDHAIVGTIAPQIDASERIRKGSKAHYGSLSDSVLLSVAIFCVCVSLCV